MTTAVLAAVTALSAVAAFFLDRHAKHTLRAAADLHAQAAVRLADAQALGNRAAFDRMGSKR